MGSRSLSIIFVVTAVDIKKEYPALSDADLDMLNAAGQIPSVDGKFAFARTVVGYPASRSVQNVPFLSLQPESLEPTVAAVYPEGTNDPLDALEARGAAGNISPIFGNATINYSLIHTNADGFLRATRNGFLTDAAKIASSVTLLQPIRTGTWTTAP